MRQGGDGMIEVDVARSTVTIAGRVWPACALVCPPHTPGSDGLPPPADSDTEWNRMLGAGPSHGPRVGGCWEVFVPLENGLYVELQVFPDEARIDMTLALAVCAPEGWPDRDATCWLPVTARIERCAVVIDQRCTAWQRCDLDWINETIERAGHARNLSGFLLDDARAKPITLGKAHALDVEHWRVNA
jgi:hypothetical protein